MNKNNDIKKDDYYCKDCNKQYKTYKTLWEHNKKFHKTMINLSTTNNNLISTNNNLLTTNNNSDILCSPSKKYKCKYCDKSYDIQQSRWKHEQKCQLIKKQNNEEIEKLKESNKNKELEIILAKEQQKILKYEKEILKLKYKLEKSDDNLTIKQLNKKLLKHNNLIKNSNIHSNNVNSNNNNNNKIQNNIVNNNVFQITGFTKEDICDVLTMNEKKQIMNAKLDCINKLVEIVNCNVNKYNHLKNIIITNMNNNYMYKYDEDVGQFILSNKTTILNSFIDTRLSDIEIIYQQLVDMNKIDTKTKHLVERFLDKINNDDSKFIDIDGIQYENFRNYKINEIKMLLYNNQDIITNSISSMLTNDDNEPTGEIKL